VAKVSLQHKTSVYYYKRNSFFSRMFCSCNGCTCSGMCKDSQKTSVTRLFVRLTALQKHTWIFVETFILNCVYLVDVCTTQKQNIRNFSYSRCVCELPGTPSLCTIASVKYYFALNKLNDF